MTLQWKKICHKNKPPFEPDDALKDIRCRHFAVVEGEDLWFYVADFTVDWQVRVYRGMDFLVAVWNVERLSRAKLMCEGYVKGYFQEIT